MARRIGIGVALAVALTLSACDDDDTGVRGSGDIATEERRVEGFDRIRLEGTGEISVTVGTDESLVLTAEDNLLPLLTTDVRDGRLELRARESISPTEPIVYTIGATSLDGLAIAGAGDVVATGVDCATFELDVSGSSDVVIDGRCDRLDVSISGRAELDAAELVVSSASVSIAGSGDVVVDAIDELTVRISGSGNVRYLGDPETDVDITGSGDVSRS